MLRRVRRISITVRYSRHYVSRRWWWVRTIEPLYSRYFTSSNWYQQLLADAPSQTDIHYPCGTLASIVVGEGYRTVETGAAICSGYRTSTPQTAAVWLTASGGYPLPLGTLASIVVGEGYRTVGILNFEFDIGQPPHTTTPQRQQQQLLQYFEGPLGFWIQPQQHCTGWPRTGRT